MPSQSAWKPLDYVLFAIVMSLMGGLYWGVRGSGGYGGEGGAMLAGAGWATWWYLASYVGAGANRRPYGGVWVVPAIVFGVAVGGFTGYGVYISWLSGVFHYNFPDEGRPIAPGIGFFMLFLCGLHWGGIAGAFLAWCAPRRPFPGWLWIPRIAMGVGGAGLALWWLRAYPQAHLPFYSEGIYDNTDYASVQRTRNQIEPIGQHLGALAGFLLFEVARRDWRAVGVMVVMALGFAVPFCVGGIWHTFQGSGLNLGWWKHWEMSIGLGGGLAFGLAFWIFNRPGDAPRPVVASRSRAAEIAEGFFSTDAPLWIVLVNNVYGAVKGRLKLHEIDLPDGAVILLIVVGVGLCTWTMFLRTRGERLVDLLPTGNRLPLGTFFLVQGSILFGALMVSVPPEMNLGNVVILSAYTFYVVASAGCAWLLYQRVGDVETIPYVTPAQRFRM